MAKTEVEEIMTDMTPATINGEINSEILTRILNSNFGQIKELIKDLQSRVKLLEEKPNEPL